MSKKIMWLLLILMSLSLYGCKLVNKQDSRASKIQEKIMSMEGYVCLAQISHIDNEKSNTYETKQIYQMDGRYRLEVTKPDHIAGLTTIFDGEKIIQYNPKLEKPKVIELPSNDFRNQIFLGTFVQNYLQSEDVSIEVQNVEDAITTVLEAVIPGGSEHMSTQRLWVDQKSYEPVRMAIYNKDNEETVIIEFLEFAYNPKINESIFMIQ